MPTFFFVPPSRPRGYTNLWIFFLDLFSRFFPFIFFIFACASPQKRVYNLSKCHVDLSERFWPTFGKIDFWRLFWRFFWDFFPRIFFQKPTKSHGRAQTGPNICLNLAWCPCGSLRTNLGDFWKNHFPTIFEIFWEFFKDFASHFSFKILSISAEKWQKMTKSAQNQL